MQITCHNSCYRFQYVNTFSWYVVFWRWWQWYLFIFAESKHSPELKTVAVQCQSYLFHTFYIQVNIHTHSIRPLTTNIPSSTSLVDRSGAGAKECLEFLTKKYVSDEVGNILIKKLFLGLNDIFVGRCSSHLLILLGKTNFTLILEKLNLHYILFWVFSENVEMARSLLEGRW